MSVSIDMPRDLIQRRRCRGFVAICAVGFQADPLVFRLATAENIEGHLATLQPGTWHHLFFRRVLWTAGSAVARTITIAAEKWMSANGWSLGNHWFRAELDVLDDLLRAEAMTLRAGLIGHADLVRLLRQQADNEADRFAQGIV